MMMTMMTVAGDGTHLVMVDIGCTKPVDTDGMVMVPAGPGRWPGVQGMENILRKVAAYYLVPVGSLASRRRDRHLSFPRHVAMFLARKSGATQQAIADGFGYSHTAVIYAEARVEEYMRRSSGIRGDVMILAERAGINLDGERREPCW